MRIFAFILKLFSQLYHRVGDSSRFNSFPTHFYRTFYFFFFFIEILFENIMKRVLIKSDVIVIVSDMLNVLLNKDIYFFPRVKRVYILTHTHTFMKISLPMSPRHRASKSYRSHTRTYR